MTDPCYAPFSPAWVRKVLAENRLWLARDRGQNYLIDRNAAEKIVALVPANVRVLEVGSGLGAITHLVAENHDTIAVEIDAGVYRLLESLVSSPRLTLVHADFLDFDEDAAGITGAWFVSNLPYSISGEAIRKFIAKPCYREGLVMLQREFVDRMTAGPGGEQYGVLAILCGTYLETVRQFTVGRNSFFPAPTIDSEVVRITKKSVPGLPQDDFARFLRQAFLSRRKTVSNNLKPLGFDAASLEALGVNPKARPEELGIDVWKQLFLASAAGSAGKP